jgi:hypothetical protein
MRWIAMMPAMIIFSPRIKKIMVSCLNIILVDLCNASDFGVVDITTFVPSTDK